MLAVLFRFAFICASDNSPPPPLVCGHLTLAVRFYVGNQTKPLFGAYTIFLVAQVRRWHGIDPQEPPPVKHPVVHQREAHELHGADDWFNDPLKS